MPDFTSLTLEVNTGTNAAPVWTNVLGAGKEVRFLDVASTLATTASAAWPFVTRPAAGTAAVDAIYAYTADAVGLGLWGTTSGTPVLWALANYLQARWNWDATGTFASAPIITAYPTTAHGAVTRADNTLLGGSVESRSGGAGTERSYLKAIAYDSNLATMPAAPAASAAAAPLVTDGATGAVAGAGAAAWTAVQGLQGDNDYIQHGATPTAVTAQLWHFVFRLFMGISELTGTFTGPLTLKYTFT